MPGPLEADMARTPADARAVQHVDGGHFAFGLQEDAADLRQVERGRLGDFAGRRDGVPVIRAAAGQHRGLHDGFVALVSSFHASLLSTRLQAAAGCSTSLSTVMPPGSGQTKKQMPQPVQPAPRYSAGW